MRRGEAKRALSWLLDAIEELYLIPVIALGIAAIGWFIIPDFFRVTLAREPAATTVRHVIDGRSPKFVVVKGRFDYKGIRYRCRKNEDLGRCLPEAYLYPIFDASGGEGVYVESPLNPEFFVPMHPGETTIVAVTKKSSTSDRRHHLFLDATEISEWSEGVLKTARKIDMNNPSMEEVVKLLLKSGKAPLKVNDEIYLKADFSIYRGFSGYFIGGFAIIVVLSGIPLVAFSAVAGIENLRRKHKDGADV